MKRRNRLSLTRRSPSLRFSPTAWAKLLFLRDWGDTEIGGFGISAGDDLLRVEDIELVTQRCSWTHVAFDDEAVADYFDAQVDAGRRPETFGRIWVHTHPGDCPLPSSTDEATFARVFGHSDWAVMFIIARSGQTYARLTFNIGPGAASELAVEVDYTLPFAGSDWPAWQAAYLSHVHRAADLLPGPEISPLIEPDLLLDELVCEPSWPDFADETFDFAQPIIRSPNDRHD